MLSTISLAVRIMSMAKANVKSNHLMPWRRALAFAIRKTHSDIAAARAYIDAAI